MPSDGRPRLFSIPVNRAFADALALGLIARHGDGALGLATGMILLPSNRAKAAVQAAFVRAGGAGLLMPRLVAIGDADLDENVGLALDSIDADPLPPAIDPLRRRLMLAALIEGDYRKDRRPIDGAAALRLADGLARVIDQLHYEEIAPKQLIELDPAIGLVAEHWQHSLDHLRLLVDRWPVVLASIGAIDLADRRNRLLDRVVAGWRSLPPSGWVVAAGVTTAAPAIARLMRAVADLPSGMVVLPGVDLAMAAEEWDALGPTAAGPHPPGSARALEAHPQYHLKLLLARMGVAREEFQTWDSGSPFDGPAARAEFVSLLFAPAAFTARWQQLPDANRQLPGVSGAIFTNEAAEAQGIALMLRAALEVPGQTAALVTPDRQLAARVGAALARWGVGVDDSAGTPLSRTPPGIVTLLAAQLAADFSAVGLIALLGHPLVRAGDERLAWLDQVRALDLLLRRPGLRPGLAGVSAHIAQLCADKDDRDHRAALRIAEWWSDLSAQLEALFAPFAPSKASPADLLAALRETLITLAGDGPWQGAAGRMLGDLFDRWALASGDGPVRADPAGFAQMVEDLMAGASVRPPYGGHPRLFLWGLLEARLQRADVMILGGLDEGRWPQTTTPDPWLAPGIRRALGLAAPERQQGMAAHDFAGALAAQRVVITRSERSGSDPSVASRFWLRLTALAGALPEARLGDIPVAALADALDVPPGKPEPAKRPAPAPLADTRPRKIRVTGVDQLAKDPYAFYARAVLGLSALEPLGAGPTPAWLGTRVHALLEAWEKAGATVAALEAQLAALASDPALDGLARAFWLPRIVPAIRWAAETVWHAKAEGRMPLASEAKAEHVINGIKLSGKADRVDRLADGGLAIVDYKTGAAPSGTAAATGLDNQLGLLGLLAEAGQLDGVDKALVASLEYWTLKANRKVGSDGSIVPSHSSGRKLKTAAEAIERAETAFHDLTDRYLLGNEAFVPGTHKDAARYDDYHQLMRRDEWFGRGEEPGA